MPPLADRWATELGFRLVVLLALAFCLLILPVQAAALLDTVPDEEQETGQEAVSDAPEADTIDIVGQVFQAFGEAQPFLQLITGGLFGGLLVFVLSRRDAWRREGITRALDTLKTFYGMTRQLSDAQGQAAAIANVVADSKGRNQALNEIEVAGHWYNYVAFMYDKGWLDRKTIDQSPLQTWAAKYLERVKTMNETIDTLSGLDDQVRAQVRMPLDKWTHLESFASGRRSGWVRRRRVCAKKTSDTA
ncbi:MAG: hypothetical protein JJT90_15535 [Ectothiorhodospiraceae bacterium]|nr:hypothetical protein [Ectothiorhodospiraceae bacterium]